MRAWSCLREPVELKGKCVWLADGPTVVRAPRLENSRSRARATALRDFALALVVLIITTAGFCRALGMRDGGCQRVPGEAARRPRPTPTDLHLVPAGRGHAAPARLHSCCPTAAPVGMLEYQQERVSRPYRPLRCHARPHARNSHCMCCESPLEPVGARAQVNGGGSIRDPRGGGEREERSLGRATSSMARVTGFCFGGASR